MTQTDNYYDGYSNRRTRGTARSERGAKISSRKSRSDRAQFGSRPQPPVMVRGGSMGLPLPASKRKKQKVRRRYDFTLNIPGAEMRLPAVPQISIGIRLISGVLVLALGMLLYHLWSSPIYQVEEAEIIGLQRLTSVDVNSIIDIAGELIFTINGETLQRRLQEAFPEFSSVSVSVGLPRNVSITVEERLPILTWRQEGRTVLVDANGIAFPLRNQTQSEPGLVIEAFDAPPTIDFNQAETNLEYFLPVEMVSAIISMSGHAPENAVLVYNTNHGLGWRDSQGWEVYFGDIKDIDIKLRIYEAMVDKFAAEGLKPVLISVEYMDSPYYRMA